MYVPVLAYMYKWTNHTGPARDYVDLSNQWERHRAHQVTLTIPGVRVAHTPNSRAWSSHESIKSYRNLTVAYLVILNKNRPMPDCKVQATVPSVVFSVHAHSCKGVVADMTLH